MAMALTLRMSAMAPNVTVVYTAVVIMVEAPQVSAKLKSKLDARMVDETRKYKKP